MSYPSHLHSPVRSTLASLFLPSPLASPCVSLTSVTCDRTHAVRVLSPLRSELRIPNWGRMVGGRRDILPGTQLRRRSRRLSQYRLRVTSRWSGCVVCFAFCWSVLLSCCTLALITLRSPATWYFDVLSRSHRSPSCTIQRKSPLLCLCCSCCLRMLSVHSVVYKYSS
ncbi:hypothetical protein LXA43DRAFT_171792 [Ganoderma leucocontextum]|nr:hypothetical protein LXA43DRAFT_171792 [Ganoderma leucocontextum]